MIGSKEEIYVHITTIFFIAFLDFFFNSSVLFSYMYTANKWVKTYSWANAFACLFEWPPIWPNAHAAAPFTKSSGIWIKESFSIAIPFPSIIDIAVF